MEPGAFDVPGFLFLKYSDWTAHLPPRMEWARQGIWVVIFVLGLRLRLFRHNVCETLF